MRVSEGLFLVSAGLHGAAAVFHASLHRATGLPEHRAFARFASTLCVYILANGWAHGLGHDAWWAAAVTWVVGGLAVAALAEMTFALTGRTLLGRTPSQLYAAMVTLGLLTVATASFIEAEPGHALSTIPSHPVARTAALLQTVFAFVVLAASVTAMAREAVARPDLRGFVAGFAAAVALGMIDETWRAITGERLHISEHAGALTVIASTVALADRQVRIGAALEQKRSDLMAAHALLAQARHDRGRQEPLAALGELSAVVAHEVRNPLAIVKNAVSSLRRTGLDPNDRTTLLEIIGEEAGRLSRLVRDLLAFARPRAAREGAIEVSSLVHRAVRDATQGQASLIARIEADVAGAGEVTGDPELLRLALANVVENALHATETGGRVRIGAAHKDAPWGPCLALIVEDDGPGMPAGVAEKARDPFFTTRPTGTGLGLAIVERVMRSHEGALFIDSALGRGCRVELLVPVGRRSATSSDEMAEVGP